MKGKFLRISLLIAIVSVLFFAQGAQALDVGHELLRLKKEVPSAATFGGNGTVVWLRNLESHMRNDGAMENTHTYIFMIGESVPDELRTLRYPVPAGGSLSIEEIGWYNTMTLIKEGTLPSEIKQLPGGANYAEVTLPDETVGRAVVISFKEIHPQRYGVDETVNMAGTFPIWEQNVKVELPYGTKLYWTGREMNDPEESKNGNTEIIKWQVTNQLQWNGEGFVLSERPLLSFSTKKGVTQGLRALDDLAQKIPALPMPEISAKKGYTRQNGLKLIEWVCAPERTLTGFPENWVREAENIPQEGPWTPWEQTFLLARWLKQLGWDVNFWWEAMMKVDEDSPGSTTIFAAPILELTANASTKTSYFKAGLPFDFDRLPAAISSSTIYSLPEGADKFISKTLPTSSPTDNKLSLLWVLKLNEHGLAEGKLDITVLGGWSDLFSGGDIPAVGTIQKILKEKLNFALQGLVATPTEVKPMSHGYKLSFDVRCAPGIVHGGSMLLRLPGGIPLVVTEMIQKDSEYTLRFPFIIDQKVRMDMPGGYRLLQSPPLIHMGEKTGAVLKESITHWPKKADLLADSTWVVSKRNVNEALTSILRQELNAMLRWPVLDLPFKKK